jgi:hypothetical protein
VICVSKVTKKNAAPFRWAGGGEIVYPKPKGGKDTEQEKEKSINLRVV